MSNLTFVFKVSDQCNLNCPYCYYYALDGATLRKRKHKDIGEKLSSFVEALKTSKAVAEADNLMIVLHGGEPLLAPKEDIREFLKHLRLQFGNKLRLSVQTNALLIDDEWIELFAQYDVGVGVSIDGPPAHHDKYRIYANGKGSYEDTKAAFNRINAAYKLGKLSRPGVLAVFHPDLTAKDYFHHYVDELGVENYDILFPDDLYRFDDPNGLVEAFNKLVQDTWRIWLDRDDPKIRVRFIDASLYSIVNKKPYLDNPEEVTVLVADLEGQCFLEDTLRSNINSIDLSVGTWTDGGLDSSISRAYAMMAPLRAFDPSCHDCGYFNACRGGGFSQRVKQGSNAFGKSVLCKTYITGFDKAVRLINTLSK